LNLHLNSWLSYPEVRRLSAIWGDTPTGLGYFDIALYILIGRELERSARAGGGRDPYWVLDLGTYFGHSSLTAAYGASAISKNPLLRILSLDIFEQPQWLLESNPEVRKFVVQYGSTGPEAIARRLDEACSQIGLTANPIQLMKRDVLTLSSRELAAIAPEGYKLIMVDCGKTPELMNRICEFLTDRQVCPEGTIIVFQDFFDWHAPWNVYAFWRLLKAGALSLYQAGSRVQPFGVKAGQAEVGMICDQIAPSRVPGEQWCTPFASLENELAALDDFIALFARRHYGEFKLKLECLKAGAFLRAGRLDEAQFQIAKLDAIWPAGTSDHALRNAYCRLMHLRTGKKDLSLATPAMNQRSESAGLTRKLRGIVSRLAYLKPIHSREILLPSTR
jgi:hypothetical protein